MKPSESRVGSAKSVVSSTAPSRATSGGTVRSPTVSAWKISNSSNKRSDSAPPLPPALATSTSTSLLVTVDNFRHTSATLNRDNLFHRPGSVDLSRMALHEALKNQKRVKEGMTNIVGQSSNPALSRLFSTSIQPAHFNRSISPMHLLLHNDRSRRLKEPTRKVPPHLNFSLPPQDIDLSTPRISPIVVHARPVMTSPPPGQQHSTDSPSFSLLSATPGAGTSNALSVASPAPSSSAQAHTHEHVSIKYHSDVTTSASNASSSAATGGNSNALVSVAAASLDPTTSVVDLRPQSSYSAVRQFEQTLRRTGVREEDPGTPVMYPLNPFCLGNTSVSSSAAVHTPANLPVVLRQCRELERVNAERQRARHQKKEDRRSGGHHAAAEPKYGGALMLSVVSSTPDASCSSAAANKMRDTVVAANNKASNSTNKNSSPIRDRQLTMLMPAPTAYRASAMNFPDTGMGQEEVPTAAPVDEETNRHFTADVLKRRASVLQDQSITPPHAQDAQSHVAAYIASDSTPVSMTRHSRERLGHVKQHLLRKKLTEQETTTTNPNSAAVAASASTRGSISRVHSLAGAMGVVGGGGGGVSFARSSMLMQKAQQSQQQQQQQLRARPSTTSMGPETGGGTPRTVNLKSKTSFMGSSFMKSGDGSSNNAIFGSSLFVSSGDSVGADVTSSVLYQHRLGIVKTKFNV